MICEGCGQPLGAPWSRLVPYADSPYGVPYFECGACGSQTLLGRSLRELIGESPTASGDESLETSWEPCDNVAEDWVRDPEEREVLSAGHPRVRPHTPGRVDKLAWPLARAGTDPTKFYAVPAPDHIRGIYATGVLKTP